MRIQKRYSPEVRGRVVRGRKFKTTVVNVLARRTVGWRASGSLHGAIGGNGEIEPDPKLIHEILTDGASKARSVTKETLVIVKEVMNLAPSMEG